MTDRDPKLSKIYQDLGKEEPPRALDEEILVASRRGASARPASFDRATRQRWYGPLAAAAVIMLAVAVTLHVRYEEPELVATAPSAPRQRAETPIAPAAQEPVKATPKSPPVQMKAPERDERKRFVPDPPAPPPPAAEAPQVAAREMARAERAPAPATAPMMAKRASEAPADTPEKELERIAELRRQERHEEADQALKEFRRRHPDYRIATPMLERVERR